MSSEHEIEMHVTDMKAIHTHLYIWIYGPFSSKYQIKHTQIKYSLAEWLKMNISANAIACIYLYLGHG